MLQDVEHLQCGDALAVGRQLPDVEAAVARGHRLDPIGGMRREVPQGHVAVELGGLGDDAFGDLAFVERRRPAFGDLAVAAPQQRIAEHVPEARDAALRVVHGGQVREAFCGPVTELRRGDHGRERKALLGVVDGGLQAARETQPPEAFAEHCPAADTPGHRPRQRALARNAAQPQRVRLLQVPRVRCPPAGVEPEQPLILRRPHEGEQVPADAVAAGLGQAEHGVGGDGRIHAATAGLEDIDAHQGRQRLTGADDAVLAGHGRAMGVAPVELAGVEERARARGQRRRGCGGQDGRRRAGGLEELSTVH